MVFAFNSIHVSSCLIIFFRINCYDNFDIAVPFGGYKASGHGREKGEDSLHDYSEVKSVCHWALYVYQLDEHFPVFFFKAIHSLGILGRLVLPLLSS